MASPSLSVRIADLARRAVPSGQIGRDHHQTLFLLYLEIDETLARCRAGCERPTDRELAALVEAQTTIMNTSSILRARTIEDTLFKLALWRWDCLDRHRPETGLSRGESVAYSLFKDLAVSSMHRYVLTAGDLGA